MTNVKQFTKVKKLEGGRYLQIETGFKEIPPMKSAKLGTKRHVVLTVEAVTFDSSHFLPDYDGTCGNLHGHTWHVNIKISGVIDNKTGMLVDFKTIKALIRDFDHTDLNCLIDIPTAENLAYLIGYTLQKQLPKRCKVVMIQLYETENHCVEVNW